MNVLLQALRIEGSSSGDSGSRRLRKVASRVRRDQVDESRPQAARRPTKPRLMNDDRETTDNGW